MPTHQRQSEPEAGAVAGLAPSFQPALVQPRVFDADRQAEPGSTGAPHPRRVRPPEPAEHQLLLARPQPDAVVADGDRDGVFVVAHPDPHRLVLGVVDRVRDQVAQNPLDPAGIDLGDDVLVRHVDDHLDPRVLGQMTDIAQRAVDGGPQIDCLDRQFGDTRVVAGDFQQVAEQRLEPVELVDHQLGGPSQRRVEVFTVVVDQVGGHPHGGQRRAQFVADVRGEPALQVAEFLELGDLAGQAFGHVVERHRQPGHVVFAVDRHSLGQVPVGESLGGPRSRPNRTTTCRVTIQAIPASSTINTRPPVAIVPRTSAIVLCSLPSGKTRYSSRLFTRDIVGVPITSAGPEKPSVCTIAYW